MLTRADSRSREVAVRAALGAGIGDILRLSLTESLILGMAGGALGLGFAWGGVRLLVLRAPTTIPRIGELAVDWRVVAFTLAFSIGTGVLFGLVPLARVSRLDLANALRDGRGQSGGLDKRRARSALVVAEMALAVLLLIGAGLTIRSFVNLTRIDAGFDAGNLLTTRFSLPSAKYATIESANGFYRTLGDAVRQLPGVRSAGFIRLLTTWRTVIAVMGDVHHNGLIAPPKRGFYLPQEQWAAAFGFPRRAMTLVIRTAGDPRAVLEPVRAIVHGMDADLPLT